MQRLYFLLAKINPLILSVFILSYLAFMVFGASGHDDSHITYSAAKMLADGAGLKNTNGHAIEQGSSLLHVVLLAGLYKISHIQLPLLGTYFSFFMAVASLVLSYRLILRCPIHNAAIPLTMISLSTAFAYWSLGGLESSLLCFCLLALILSLIRSIENPKLCNQAMLVLSTAAFICVRPEAFFILIAFVVGSFILLSRESAKKNAQQQLGLLSIAAIIAFALLCYARWEYFGQIFPQPVYAKSSSFSLDKIAYGLAYFFYSAQPSLIIMPLLLIAAAIRWFKKQAINNLALLFSIAISSSYLAFIISSGGDWMGGGRFFVAIIPFLFIYSCQWIEKLRYKKAYFYALYLLLVIEIAFFAQYLSLGIPIYRLQEFRNSFVEKVDFTPYSWTEVGNVAHVIDIQFIDALTPIIASQDPEKTLTIASIQMGMTPFYLRQHFGEQLHFVDMRGLTSRELSDCAAFDHFPKIWTGMFVSYQNYFDVQRSGDCDLPPLDIIYDLLNNVSKSYNDKQLRQLVDAGYHIVYQQKGGIKDLTGEMHLKSYAFIAVSDAIYLQLNDALKDRHFRLSNYYYQR